MNIALTKCLCLSYFIHLYKTVLSKKKTYSEALFILIMNVNLFALNRKIGYQLYLQPHHLGRAYGCVCVAFSKYGNNDVTHSPSSSCGFTFTVLRLC